MDANVTWCDTPFRVHFRGWWTRVGSQFVCEWPPGGCAWVSACIPHYSCSPLVPLLPWWTSRSRDVRWPPAAGKRRGPFSSVNSITFIASWIFQKQNERKIWARPQSHIQTNTWRLPSIVSPAPCKLPTNSLLEMESSLTLALMSTYLHVWVTFIKVPVTN